VSANQPNGWHRIEAVTKVTVRENGFYVRGDNVSGYSCTDESQYYGTLNHLDTEPSHDKFYSLALMAHATGKGMACYVTNVRANGVCIMRSCHLL